MIEWFVIGNSPWRNPSANQPGMFFYWASVFTLPRILVADGDGLRRLRRWLTVTLAVHATGSLAVGFLTPPVYRMFVLVWLVILTYSVLQAFVVWHLALAAKQEPSPAPHVLSG